MISYNALSLLNYQVHYICQLWLTWLELEEQYFHHHDVPNLTVCLVCLGDKSGKQMYLTIPKKNNKIRKYTNNVY